MPDLKIYDAQNFTLSLFGYSIESGYADGDFVTVEQDEQSFTAKVGTDGEVTRSKTGNKLTTVKVKLMQTSRGNSILSGVLNLDEASNNGKGVGPMYLKDRSGTFVFAASKSWITGPPAAPFGREANEREWTLHCIRDERYDGGS